ncbi:GDSL esterase/lipase At1g28570-like [Henckelia pumila]|uniref:GDSL esterase/lipase At1g28570-like n=1 Tax=Henckelia pumila TaxID=405737 RepID=UPI003C6E50FF
MAPPCTPRNPPPTSVTLAFTLLLSITFPALSSCRHSPPRCFGSIISFGDSLADTGNLLRLSGSSTVSGLASARLPYGETFFHHPTGRFSDGRLVIDFIAESLGLPLVPPYVGGGDSKFGGQSFDKGVNFAVAGATALDAEYLKEMGVYNLYTNASLGVQMEWFKQFLVTLQDGKRFLENSLVLLGEIGGNDYNLPLDFGIRPEQVRSLAPTIVRYIGSTLQELIQLGAKTILVPGNFPIGCFPGFLKMSNSDNYKNSSYDPKTGCVNWLNELSRHHNELLQKELNRVQDLHPHVSIIYADYYNALLKIYLSPREFGIGKGMLSACCGGGGPFNFNKSALCGFPLAKSCEDPSLYISWDGLHLTEVAYKFLAQAILGGCYTVPHLDAICSFTSQVAEFYE